MSEKYFFGSPIFEYPAPGNKQDKIKVSGAYWLGDERVMVLERDSYLVRFHELDFSTGDNLLTDTRYSWNT